MPAKIILTGFLYYLAPMYLAHLGNSQSATGRIMMLYGLMMVLMTPLAARTVGSGRTASAVCRFRRPALGHRLARRALVGEHGDGSPRHRRPGPGPGREHHAAALPGAGGLSGRVQGHGPGDGHRLLPVVRAHRQRPRPAVGRIPPAYLRLCLGHRRHRLRCRHRLYFVGDGMAFRCRASRATNTLVAAGRHRSSCPNEEGLRPASGSWEAFLPFRPPQRGTPRADARASGAEAIIAHLKLLIAKLKRERFGPSSEHRRRLLDQLELQLEELEASATQDAYAAETGQDEGAGRSPRTPGRCARRCRRICRASASSSRRLQSVRAARASWSSLARTSPRRW